MNLRHATSYAAWKIIQKEGLDPGKARGKVAAVWLHSPLNTIHAIEHAARRLGIPEAELVVLDVNVPEEWLYRHVSGGRQAYYTGRHIPASRIVEIGPARDWLPGGLRSGNAEPLTEHLSSKELRAQVRASRKK